MRRLAVMVALVAALSFTLVGTANGSSPSPIRSQAAGVGCDPIDATQCLTPFPDNFFTWRDTKSPTGRRVHFPANVMPVNNAGVAIDPTDWNRNDGFSPGSEIIVNVPGINLAKTGAAPITDIARSL